MTHTEAIQAVEAELQKARARQERARDRRIEEVRERLPEVKRLQLYVADRFARGARAVLSRGDDAEVAIASVKADVADAQAKIASLLKQAGIAPGYMDLEYDCPACKDTGYVGEVRATRCQCFTQRLIDLEFNYASGNAEHRFGSFDLTIYPTDAQREQAEGALAICRDYAAAYPSTDKLNLVLLGNSGLGKTFLLDSVAHHLVERGQVALCVTAFRMLEAMRAYHMGEPDAFGQLLNCPALFIDDLGTEPLLRNISLEYLFNLLNERISLRKHTVIATNLSPAQLNERYGERVMSRMLDQANVQAIRLTGEDLRLRGQRGR